MNTNSQAPNLLIIFMFFVLYIFFFLSLIIGNIYYLNVTKDTPPVYKKIYNDKFKYEDLDEDRYTYPTTTPTTIPTTTTTPTTTPTETTPTTCTTQCESLCKREFVDEVLLKSKCQMINGTIQDCIMPEAKEGDNYTAFLNQNKPGKKCVYTPNLPDCACNIIFK
jgi:hypothetical protein